MAKNVYIYLMPREEDFGSVWFDLVGERWPRIRRVLGLTLV